LTTGLIRISSNTTQATGSTNLGVIPTTLAFGHDSVWAAAAQPPSGRLLIWRLNPLSMRVTQAIHVGQATS